MSATTLLGQDYVLAEFPTAEALVDATVKMRTGGFPDLDTHSPYPLEGGDEALGLPRSKVPRLALGGALVGMFGGFGMMAWMNGVNWPINVAGRPPIAVPAFIPITFECTILVAGLSIFFGLLAMMKLPQPYHPVFDLESFRSACNDGFWLSVAAGPNPSDRIVQALEGLGAKSVSVVQEQVE